MTRHSANSTTAHFAAAMAVGGVIAMGTGSAAAQSGKPVRFIVPYAAGGAVDVYARVFAKPMAAHLGRPIIIENVAGGGGNVGVARVSKSAPDGDTLLYHNMAMAVNPSLYKKLDYDPLTDFAHIGVASHSVMAVVARNGFPPQDMKSLIAYAKANGDKVTFADGGAGGIGLGEVLGHDRVHGRELGDVGDVDGDLDHIGQRSATGFPCCRFTSGTK